MVVPALRLVIRAGLRRNRWKIR
ncbi:hypothetical protein LINPERPRIM_LOCUS11819 [Linum perenne]